MPSHSFTILVLSLLMLACDGLKLSPPGGSMLDIKWFKRQARSTSDPRTTTISAPNSLLPPGANTCVCRLVYSFNQYVTFTSTYVASQVGDSESTTTLATADGTTPGTVEVLTPLTYSTVTIIAGSVPATSTVATTNAAGQSTTVVVVDVPLSTTTTTAGSVGFTSTVTTTDANGSSYPIILVDIPLSTITTTAGNSGFTSTITTTDANGSSYPVVLVDVPLSTITTTAGNSGFTSTITTTDASGSSYPVVLVDIPLSTITTTAGSVAFTSTITTTDANGSSYPVVLVEIPLSTTTTTSGSIGYTSTVTTTDASGSPYPIVVVDEPALCGNQGWQFGYARIPLVDHGFTNDFDYSTLQTAQYSYIGTTSYVGINPNTPSEGNNGPYVGPQINYYGQYTDSEGQASLNHRAYFIPPTDGTYTFTINQADDEAAIYFGSAALRGYNNNNWIVETSYGGGSKSVTQTLTQYSCNPVRVIWVDGGSPGSFNITISGPDGATLNNGDYIRDACCSNTPLYSAFGNEA